MTGYSQWHRTGDKCLAVKRLELVKLRAVDQAGNDLLDVKETPQVCSDNPGNLGGRVERLLCCRQRRRLLLL